jgi:peptide/nickel transport system substrate-binding protein/oligopeptide transport system substrate-binding protein
MKYVNTGTAGSFFSIGKLLNFFSGLFVFLALISCAAPAVIETEMPPDRMPEAAPVEPLAEPDILPLKERADTEPLAEASEKPLPDELAVVFSRGEIQLDFRASYLASEAQLYTALYEGLYSYDPRNMAPVRALASRAELSADKKRWTFTIRQGAKYQNGDPVRAGDFKASWISLLDPAKESPYSSLFDIIEGAEAYRLGRDPDPGKIGIQAVDDRTLVVHLNSPAAFFPSMLCHHSFSPIHPSMLNVEDWSKQLPVSNGPFYIERLAEDKAVFVKNRQYWDASHVALEKITIRFAEAEEASGLWNSGESRWISGDVELDNLINRDGILINPMFATHYYFIRSALKPWNDYRVRRALSLVLPWEEIRDGLYIPARTLIFSIPGYPEVEGVEKTNEEEAVRLLSEAGYPRGRGIPELVIRLTPSPDAARIGELMAAAWKEKLGISVRIDVVSYAGYFQSLKRNDYVVGSTTWIGDFADPYTFLQMWRRNSNLNDARFDDQDYEDLIEESMTAEGEKRMEILSKAEKLLLDRGAVLPISFSPALNVISTAEIDGWYPNVLDIHPFKYLRFKALRPLPNVALVE